MRFCSQGLIDSVVSCKELMDTMVDEAEGIIQGRLPGMIGAANL